jgi:hypothetical protein
MHIRSPFCRLIASVALTSIFSSTLAPLALAQSAAAPAAPVAPSPAAPSPSAPAPAAPAPSAPAPAPSGPAAAAPAAPAAAPAKAAPTKAVKGGKAVKEEPAPLSPEEEKRNQARASFEAGTAAYNEGNYKLASEQFQAAYAQVPSPHAEYWIAKALDGQGDKAAEAAKAYQTFIDNPNANQVGDDKLAEAKTRLDAIKATLPAKVTVTTEPAGAGITVDGAAATAVSPTTLELAPGAHKIEVTLEGYETTKLDLTVKGGDALEQKVELKAAPTLIATAPAPTAAPAPEKKERSMVPAYVTLGLAGAGVAVGTVFGVMALNDKSDYDDQPTADKADDVERNALIADMAFGVALTLGITGIVLLTSDDGEEQPKAAATNRLVVAPYASPTGGGAAARLVF